MLRLQHIIRYGYNHIDKMIRPINSNCRFLYTQNSLGIDSYIDVRQNTKKRNVENVEQFYSKMDRIVEDSTSMVLTDDLKIFIHIVESNNENALNLLIKMLKKYHTQNKGMRYANYIFGPVVMRFFAYSGNDETALQLFKDSEFDGFFNQLISHQILLDMLYNNKRYQDVIDVFELIRSRNGIQEKHSNNTSTIVFATCYRQNTQESFEYAMKLWKDILNTGMFPSRRCASYVALLALKQNAPNVAIEIIASVNKQSYVTIRNIKLLALAELGKIDDALAVLRSVLEVVHFAKSDGPKFKQTFCREVIDIVRDKICKHGNNDSIQKFDRLEKYLLESNQINDDKIDDYLSTEIAINQNSDVRKDKVILAASYNSSRDRTFKSQIRPSRRLGLIEQE